MAFLDETGLADLWSLICNKHDGLVNEYVWAKKGKIAVTSSVNEGSAAWIAHNASYSCADEVTVINGSISLVSPTTKTLSSNGGNASEFAGKYISTSDYGIIYLVSATGAVTNGYLVNFNYRTVSVGSGVVGYVNSPDPAAYPINDGYDYEFRGKIGGAMQIETGSYVGTGTCGTENPNSLTFPFVPRIVIVYAAAWPQRSSYGWKQGGFIWVNPCTKDKIDYNSSGDAFYLWFSLNSNTLTYNLGAANTSSYSQTLGGMAPAFQCNESGKTYYYIALG